MSPLTLARRLKPDLLLKSWHLIESARPPAYPATAHDTVELAWVDQGACRYHLGRTALDVQEGEAVLVPADVEHRTEILPGTRAVSLQLGRDAVDQVCQLTGQRLKPGRVALPDAARVFPRIDAADGAMVQAAFDGLLLGLIAAPAPDEDPRINRAIAQIDAELGQPLTVELLAKTAKMSRFHFSRVFRAQTGKSPYRFLTERRVERAAALLRAGQHNVTEAAMLAGFSDLGRFGRAFKAQMALTPSSYRRAHRSTKRAHESHGGRRRRSASMEACERSSSSASLSPVTGR